MCDAPRKLADGTEVACQECKTCLEAIRDNWVGRCLAEAHSSKFCYVITATYGRGKRGEVLHERAVILTYSDVQKFIKLLKRHGYDVRHFTTGEYGSERGRAHWNILLFSDDPLPGFAGWDQYGRWTPKARFKQRFNWVRTNDAGGAVYVRGHPAFWWPHGFVHVDELNLKSVRYCCKYVTKDLDTNGKQGKWGYSRFPPLGTAWFLRMAEKYVEQGLAPQTQEYRFPDVKRKNGQPVKFWLKGRVMELMLDHYLLKWREKWPDREHPKSDLLDRYELYGEDREPGQKLVKNPLNAEITREFPKGESKQPVAIVGRDSECARRKRAERYAYGIWYWESIRMQREWFRYIMGAPDGQARQARRYTVEFWEREWDQDAGVRTDKKYHAEGFWSDGAKWRDDPQGERSCACRYCAKLQADADAAKPSQPLDPEWLGKVGQWNHDYPRSGQA